MTYIKQRIFKIHNFISQLHWSGALALFFYFLYLMSVSMPMDPLAVPAPFDMRSVLKARERAARFASHLEFLQQCIAHDVIPKGLRISYSKGGFPKSPYLHKRVDDNIKQTERDNLLACRDTYQGLLNEANEETNKCMYELFNNTSHLEFEEILKKLNRPSKKIHRDRVKKEKKLRFLLNETKTNVNPSSSQTLVKQSLSNPESNAFSGKRKRNRRFVRRNVSSNSSGDNTNLNNVVNLSSTELSGPQKDVLSMGPKFCPVPKSINIQNVSMDVDEGLRKVRLKELFYDDENDVGDGGDIPKFYKPTGYCPPRGRDQTLDTYCDTIRTQLDNFSVDNSGHKCKDNMTQEQRKALKELKSKVQNREIRISKADKGGAVVVQNTDDYVQEGLRQLNNSVHYVKEDCDSTKSIAKDSNKLVHKLFNAGSIDEKTKDWALTEESLVQCHRFYTLPKIHKSLNNTPGRPIISGTNGPTEKLSKLVDSWLQNSVKQVDSYIQDSTDMLRMIENWNQQHGPFPAHTRLVTIDVVGLYTNIPHDDMMSSLRQRLDSTPALDRPPTGAVMEVAQHVLLNNVFSFEGQVYRQIHGTAMGTPMAPVPFY